MFGVLEGQIILGFRGTNPGVIFWGGGPDFKSLGNAMIRRVK